MMEANERKQRKAERRKRTAPQAMAATAVSTAEHAVKKKTKLTARAVPPMSADAATVYLAEHEIAIHEDGHELEEGGALWPPCLSLARAPFPPALVSQLCAQPGFTAPSPVQAATWPIAVAGRDVLAIAKTGSGKTLGFLLPVLVQCRAMRDEQKANKPSAARGGEGAPLGLVMAPTRELALQIAAEATKYGACVRARAVAVYGGASKAAQVRALQRGCDLIIGTPGRIGDVLGVRHGGGEACVSTEMLSMVVLDEADRMLDMGFERDIRAIIWHAFGERERQTFLYSATWPVATQSVAADLLTRPVKVTVGSGGDRLTASRSVVQRVHVVDARARWEALLRLLAPFAPGGADAEKRVIVFANMKLTVKEIFAHCRDAMGLRVDAISGDRSQAQREATIRRFKDGSVRVVVATDVAARGLDIKGIDRVINYELPMDDFQDYVHRIGRTGRAGATGEADSLFTEGDRRHAKELTRIMTEAGQLVPQALAKFTSQSTKFADSDDESD
jgi:ATP-dependent RNA helicase DDX5/DBP2